MQHKFTPAQAQLEAAAHLFIAMALRDIAKEAFHKMQAQVLAAGKYRNAKFGKLHYEEVPEFITDPKHDYHIVGIGEGSPPESDAGRYFSEVDRLAKSAGWINGLNADCILDNNVIKAENTLITVMEPINKIGVEDIIMLDHRRQLVKLMLQLFAPYMERLNMESRKRKYFLEHVYESTHA